MESIEFTFESWLWTDSIFCNLTLRIERGNLETMNDRETNLPIETSIDRCADQKTTEQNDETQLNLHVSFFFKLTGSNRRSRMRKGFSDRRYL